MPLPEIIRRSGFRWGVALAAVLAAATILMSAMIYWLGSYALFRTVDKSITEQLELLAARPPYLLPFMITSRMGRDPYVITRVGLFDSERHRIVGNIRTIPDGLRLNSKVQMIVGPPEADGALPHLRFAGRRLPDGRILVVARSVEDLLEMRGSLLKGVVVSLLPAILLSIGGGLWVGARTQRRLLRLRHTAERIMSGHLDERLAARIEGDELDHLAAIVNRILDRLEELVHALKGVGEDIAHDLRTPLTAVRTRLERAREHAVTQDQLHTAIDRSLDGIDQALSIVTAVLRIAEIEHSRRLAGFSTVDLAEMVHEVADIYQPVAEDKQIEFAAEADGPTEVVGDRDLLREVVLNLLDNAIKFTPPGGRVRVALAGSPTRASITVCDNGPGIPEHERGAVFRRFYRIDQSRGSKGSGLGLSLAAAVAKLHGFRLVLKDNAPGCIAELQCWTELAASPSSVANG